MTSQERGQNLGFQLRCASWVTSALLLLVGGVNEGMWGV